MPKVNSTLKAADPWLKWLIMAGTVTYFVEITTGISEGNSGHSVLQFLLGFLVSWAQASIKLWMRRSIPTLTPLRNSERNAKGSSFAGRKNKPTGFCWHAAILNVSIDPFRSDDARLRLPALRYRSRCAESLLALQSTADRR